MSRSGETLRLWVAALLLAVPLVGLSATATGDTAATEAQLEKLRARIHGLQKELDSTRGEYDRRSGQLRRTEKQMATLHLDLARTERALGESERRLTVLEDDRRRHVVALGEQRGALAEQVRAAYATGRQERLKILLNQQDPARLGRMLGYYDYLNRARVARITAIEQLLDRLQAVEHEAAAERERFAALRERHRLSASALQDERKARAEVVATLAGEIADKGRELARFRADEARLAGLIESLQRALDDIPTVAPPQRPFGELRGRLTWPADGRLGARFGQRRPVVGLAWQGVMIEAREGQAVRAVAHGRVAFADWLRGYGLLLILDHGDGYMSLYGYNQALNKEVGDWVEEGETIATVGRSGGRQRAGLYFEIRHRGKPVNPARWCRVGRASARG